MSSTSLGILLLCAPIVGQIPVLLNAPVGGSVLICCSLPVDPLSLRWFYWQENESDNILFHWDINRVSQPPADEYRNRCEVFNTEFSSGNISIRLHNVAVGDDQKTFWAYVSFNDKHSEQWCKSTLQVSAPYQDLVLTVNNTGNSATCTARGGYPEPQVSWTGLQKSSAAQLDLQDAETSLQQDPTEKTFSVTSRVSVKELQSVTCLIYNPHSNESMTQTTAIDAPGEDQQRHHYSLVGAFIAGVIFGVFLCSACRISVECPQPTESPTASGDSADRNASDAPSDMSGGNVSEDIIPLTGNQGAFQRDGAANGATDEDTTDDEEQETKLFSDSKENADETSASESFKAK